MDKHHFRAWLIIASAWAFYLYEYILRVSPSVMTEPLMADFGITSGAFGVLISFYYYSYVTLQVPCGMIVDAYGPRVVITASALLCMTGSFIFAYSPTLIMAQLGRFLMGAGSACAYLSCAKVAANWFRPYQFSMIAGIGMFMGTVGGMLGGRPVASLVNTHGWRFTMVMLGILGIVISAQAWSVIRDTPTSSKSIHKSMDFKGLVEGLKSIVVNPQSWLIFSYGCMMYLPLTAFAELWGVPFLMKTYNLTNATASQGTAAVFLGFGLGSIGAAWFSNIIKSHKKVMLGSAIGTLFIFFFIFFGTHLVSYSIMLPILFLGGFVNGAQNLYFVAAKEINHNHLSATAIGFTNCGVMVSGIIFQPIFGIVIDAFWDGRMTKSGLPFYTIACYQKACVVLSIAFLVAAILAYFIRETYPKED